MANTKRLLHSLVLLSAAPAFADYQAGLDAYEAGAFATALAEWKEEVGRPAPPDNLATYREALYGIAMLYWKGEGVEQDYSVSAVWLKQAADINHPGAQVKLGYLYSTGQGVPLNYQEARRWLQLAAVQGAPDAAYNLDILDREGLGGPDSPDAAGPHPITAPVATSQPEAAGAAADLQPDSPAAENDSVPGRDAGRAWILAQDPQHYTIQVIALRNPEPLRDFIADHPDWSPFAIYTPAGNERPLWVLLQGNYPDVASARTAAAGFPVGLQRTDNLWIRRFKMVQGLIE